MVKAAGVGGFGQVAGGASIARALAGFFGDVAGVHDDRQVVGVGVGAQAGESFVAVNIRHHDVHEYDVGQGVARDPVFAIDNAFGFCYFDVVFGQQAFQGQASQS